MWSKNGYYHPSLWTPFLRNWIPNPKFFSLTRGIKMQHILLVLIEYYVLNVRRNRYFLMLISNIGRSKFVYKISCMKILLWRGQNNSVHQTSLGMNKSDLIQCGSLCSDSLLYDQIEFVLDQIPYFDKTPTIMGKGDQGNMCKYITFWESFGAYYNLS